MSPARRACAAVIASVALYGAAGTATAALGPRYGGRVRVACAAAPLAPAGLLAGTDARLFSALVHETLLVPAGSAGDLAPSLAEAWTAGASGREWTLRLRADARFHDGSAVRADDVVRSLRRFLRAPSPAAERLAADLEGGLAFRAGRTEALPGLAGDGATIVLRVVDVVPDPLRPLQAPAAAITGASGAGAGPYTPTARLAGRMVLTPFALHVRGRPFLDELTVVTAASEPADVSFGWGGTGAAHATLLLRLEATGAFADAAARRAVAAALAAAEIPRHFLKNADVPTALLPPVLGAAAFGAERAAAGAPPAGSLLLQVASDVPDEVGQRVVATLAAAGLQVAPRTVSPLATLARAGSHLLVWTPQVSEPSIALEELAALAGGPPALLARIAAARRIADPEARRTALSRVDQALREEATVIPIAWTAVDVRADPRAHGIALRGGTVVLEDTWVEP